MKKKLVVANWKMNLNVAEALKYLANLDRRIERDSNVEIVIAPVALCLHPMAQEIKQNKFLLAAQNAYFKDAGAFTGEVSFTQLRGIADYVIVGHSERRIYFGEDDKMVRDKVQAALRNGVSPIVCIGENSHERQSRQTKRIIHDQLTIALSNITSQEIEHVVIAYEPIWAISTFDGKVATPQDAKEVLDYIRDQIYEIHGKSVSENVRVIYGGSVDDGTVAGYLSIKGCDGVLVGGASLNPEKFANIIDKAKENKNA